MADEDSPWYVQLFVSLALLVGAAVLICVVIGVFGLAGAYLVGFRTGSASSGAVSIPAVTASPQLSAHSPGSGSGPSSGHGPSSNRHAITLTATPRQVPAYGRIDLRGTYAAPDGTALQVQRQQPGSPWRNFPTGATLSSGSFTTYIKTGHTGVNRLRVIDSFRNKTSNVVTVHVG